MTSVEKIIKSDRFVLAVGSTTFTANREELCLLRQRIDQALGQTDTHLLRIIKEKAAVLFDVGLHALDSCVRSHRVANARMASMWLAIQMGLKGAEIAKAFHRDRSTVVYACSVIGERKSVDASFAKELSFFSTIVATAWDQWKQPIANGELEVGKA